MNKRKKIIRALSAVMVASSLATLSCMNDEEFLSGPQSPITFSVDTVSFDTIFTGIGSATKDFKVYNPNSKGVRLASVRLGSGGSSGFRLNLDGQYGTQFTDVEIYHGDSLYCFVEVTVDPHDSDSPILLTDSLLFTVEHGNTYKVMLQAWGQDIVVMRNIAIETDTTIAGTRPIVIMDSIVVAPDATLTVAQGTMLCFHKGAELAVHGRIICNGTTEKPIIMRGDRTDKLFPYLPYDRLDAQWGGVTLHPESFGNIFSHCNIHSGSYGIVAYESTGEDMKCEITNSIIHNVAGYGLFLHGAWADITGCQITNAGAGCVTVIGGETLFTHCTIAQLYPWNADRGPALLFSNVADNTEYPLRQIEFRNCIITGYSNDEVYGSRMQDSDADFNYMFRNCLVNTKITEADEPYFIDCKFDVEDKKNNTKDEGQKTKDENQPHLREANFRLVDTYSFNYDFALDSLSVARQMGNAAYVSPAAQYDLRGTLRPTINPDVGCYQSVE
ncbi:MAG: right-handed parallel beta-helix repeat-containing protein [Bacteroidaceae bacterium]|nr:right-handed parallel beta-helix repeat-containing protein [Bacteroidaceae bacterium]MBQ9176913.1 right-handed parallel beta-helix repeat-containing protein [Bacteroidaceae bacterium]